MVLWDKMVGSIIATIMVEEERKQQVGLRWDRIWWFRYELETPGMEEVAAAGVAVYIHST